MVSCWSQRLFPLSCKRTHTNLIVENEQHCDFVHLRELIMSRNLHDLVFTTNEHHYSKFRSSYLRKSQRSESVLLCDDDYVLKLEDSRQKLFEDLAKKESEIKEMFVQKVKEKEAHLREAEENASKTVVIIIIDLINYHCHLAYYQKG
jgi:septin family protein